MDYKKKYLKYKLKYLNAKKTLKGGMRDWFGNPLPKCHHLLANKKLCPYDLPNNCWFSSHEDYCASDTEKIFFRDLNTELNNLEYLEDKSINEVSELLINQKKCTIKEAYLKFLEEKVSGQNRNNFTQEILNNLVEPDKCQECNSESLLSCIINKFNLLKDLIKSNDSVRVYNELEKLDIFTNYALHIEQRKNIDRLNKDIFPIKKYIRYLNELAILVIDEGKEVSDLSNEKTWQFDELEYTNILNRIFDIKERLISTARKMTPKIDINKDAVPAIIKEEFKKIIKLSEDIKKAVEGTVDLLKKIPKDNLTEEEKARLTTKLKAYEIPIGKFKLSIPRYHRKFKLYKKYFIEEMDFLNEVYIALGNLKYITDLSESEKDMIDELRIDLLEVRASKIDVSKIVPRIKTN